MSANEKQGVVVEVPSVANGYHQYVRSGDRLFVLSAALCAKDAQVGDRVVLTYASTATRGWWSAKLLPKEPNAAGPAERVFEVRLIVRAYADSTIEEVRESLRDCLMIDLDHEEAPHEIVSVEADLASLKESK